MSHRPTYSLHAPGLRETALQAPSRDSRPPVDRNLLREDSHAEILDGRLVLHAAGAGEQHATEHFDIPALLGRCLAQGYRGASDMLTRLKDDTEVAPDVSIFPAARDPVTGGRQLEELAFEVIDTTPWSEVSDKARKLVARGVRRVFVVDVNAHSVSEWSPTQNNWQRLSEDATIDDRCFTQPLPVRALLDTLAADDAVTEALLARKNRALLRHLAQAEARGALNEKRALLRRVLTRQTPALTAEQVAKIEACTDPAKLDLWIELALAGEIPADWRE